MVVGRTAAGVAGPDSFATADANGAITLRAMSTGVALRWTPGHIEGGGGIRLSTAAAGVPHAGHRRCIRIAARAPDERPQVDVGQHALLGEPAVGFVIRLLDQQRELLVQHRLQFAPAFQRLPGRAPGLEDDARQHMKGYTAIEGSLTAEVPLASYMLYNEFKPSDVAYFQKFYDLFTEKGIFEKKVLVDGLLYKA